MASAPAASAASADVDRSEDVGLDTLAPVAFENRHVLQRCGMEDDVRLKVDHQAHDPIAISDVSNSAFDRGAGGTFRQRLRHRVKRSLRILDYKQSRCAEGRDAVANFRADRAPATGDYHRLALHQSLRGAHSRSFRLGRSRRSSTATLVSLGTSPLSRDGRRLTNKPSRFAHLKTASRMRLGLESRWGHDEPRDRFAASGKIADDILDIIDPAEHRDVADQLPAIRDRWRQNRRQAKAA